MDEASNAISFEDFCKVDLRVGQILTIVPVPKSKKLLKLEVDFGELGVRTILSGIASAYPDHVKEGQKVMAVVNLPSRQMMGTESTSTSRGPSALAEG